MHQQQREAKPTIEDLIPDYLNGDMRKTALDFIEYMRENKMPFRWVGTNTWQANYKSKCLCRIWLCTEEGFLGFFGRPGRPSWIVSPFLEHIGKYEEVIINRGWQPIFWDNIAYCVFSPESGIPHKIKGCNQNKWCAGGRIFSIFGKEIKNLHRDPSFPWIWDPDEATIDCIGSLLALEKQARNEK